VIRGSSGDWPSFDDWLEPAPAGWTASRSLLAEYVSCVVDGSMTADDIDLHTLPLYRPCWRRSRGTG
jgi:hypothetical protein